MSAIEDADHEKSQDGTSGGSKNEGTPPKRQPFGPPELRKPPQRQAKEMTFALIKKTFLELVKKQNSVPPMREVAEACGLTLRTVQRHLKGFDWKDQYAEYFKANTPEVLVGLLQAAKRGNPQAVKLWFEIVEGMKFGADQGLGGPQSLPKPTLIIEMPQTPAQLNGHAAIE